LAITPRAVQVVVTIESAQFRNGLGDVRRQQIETAIASEVAASLSQKFPFIDWQVNSAGDAPAGRLIAAITENPLGRPPQVAPPNDDLWMPEVSLQWRAEIGGRALIMPSVFVETLYSSTNAIRPVHDDHGNFMRDLRERVVGWVQSETNSNHVQKEFLPNVPLATSVTIEAAQQLVLVPVPWEQSRFGANSEFKVFYRGDQGDTRVTLTGLARRPSDPLTGSTQSRAGECQRGSDHIEGAQLWPTCVNPLTSNPQQKVIVSIGQYFYGNPDVFDGFITSEQ
jgi:hypothetical protein